MAVTISGTSGITFPAGGTGNPAGTVVGTTDTQSLTNKTLSTGLVMGASPVTSATAQASTSGTSIDFTGIPSWVKRITVMFNGVSTNGSSYFQIQIGAGSVDTTSTYFGGIGVIRATATSTGYANSTAFLIAAELGAGSLQYGTVILSLVGSNTWTSFGNICDNAASRVSNGGGSKALSGTLDRIRITTVGGTDTFDAGSINILYE